MWILVISLCLPILVTSSEDICEENPFEICPPLKLKDIETANELKATCPNMIEYVHCLGDYKKKCGYEGRLVVLSMEGEYESLLQLVNDICDESSLLHAALTENLQCLRNAILIGSNDACYNKEDNVFKEYQTYLNSEVSVAEEKKSLALEYCLSHFYNTTCFVEDVANNCGILAKDAAVDVLHRSYFIQIFCNSQRAEKFAEDIGRLSMTDSQKEVMKELVDKILGK